MPWWGYLLATLGPQVLSMLLPGGGRTPATQTSTTTAPPSGYQSPLLGMGDMFTFDTLARRIGDFSGFGMPGGKGNVSPLLEQILALLGTEGTKLIEGMGQGPEKGNPTVPPFYLT